MVHKTIAQALGFIPQALIQFVAGLGWTPPDEGKEIWSVDDLAQEVYAGIGYLGLAAGGEGV